MRRLWPALLPDRTCPATAVPGVGPSASANPSTLCVFAPAPSAEGLPPPPVAAALNDLAMSLADISLRGCAAACLADASDACLAMRSARRFSMRSRLSCIDSSSWRFRDLSDGGDVGLGNGCGARAAEFGLSLVLCCCASCRLSVRWACAAIDATPSCGEDDPTDGEGSAVASLEDDAGLGLRSHRIIMRKAGDGAAGCSTPQIIVAQHKVTLSDMDSSSSETSLSRFPGDRSAGILVSQIVQVRFYPGNNH